MSFAIPQLLIQTNTAVKIPLNMQAKSQSATTCIAMQVWQSKVLDTTPHQLRA